MNKEKNIDFLSLFKKFQINTSSQSELDKLKSIVKQIYNEIQNLKDEKHKIEEKFYENENDLKKEISDIKKEHAELANKISSQSEIATQEQLSKIESLENEIADLNNKIKAKKLELNESKLNCEVIQKQINQFEKNIAIKEKEVSVFDDNKHKLNIQKKRILELQDIIRIKNKQIEEMELTEKINKEEENKINKILEEMEKPKFFNICKFQPINIEQNIINFDELNEKILSQFSQEGIIFDNKENYISSLPQMIDELQQNNDELMKNSSIYKHKYAKLQVIKPVIEGMPSTEKMKDAIVKIKKSNDSKTEKIKKLKLYIEKQNEVLQGLNNAPTPKLMVINLLHQTIKKLYDCSKSERKILVSQALEFVETLSK